MSSGASLQEIVDLFAKLASHLGSSSDRILGIPKSTEDETLDRLISSLNCSLNLDGGDDDPTLMALDTALSLMCFDATKVFDSVVECTVETIVAVLSSIGCEVVKFEKDEALLVGGSIRRRDSEQVILACVEILSKLQEDGKLSEQLLCAVARAAVSASHCQYMVPWIPMIDWQGVNERSEVALKLLKHLPQEFCLKNHQLPPRILLWYLDPLIMKGDVSNILQVTMERPFLCLEKEFHERLYWQNIIVCLVLSPSMFIQARTLLHSWFLQTGTASVLDFLITLVKLIVDIISMPVQWGISAETGFRLPFCSAYFPFNHHLLRTLVGPVSAAQFAHLTDHIIAKKTKSTFTKLPGKAALVDHKSLWALAVDFPVWFYVATIILLCGDSFLHDYNLAQPNMSKQLKHDILSSGSAAAASYIAWILSPNNCRTEEIIGDFLMRVAESWMVKLSVSNVKDEEVATYVKKLKKPKYSHKKNDTKFKGSFDCQSTALWLEEFQNLFQGYHAQILEDFELHDMQSSNWLSLQKCPQLRKVPLGILIGWSGFMDESVSELLLHYATTGRILQPSNSHSDARKHVQRDFGNLQGSMVLTDECYEESVTGALLVFQLTDVVESLSASLFDDEEGELAFICQFKERTIGYLVKCTKRLIYFQAHKQGTQMQSDLVSRLLRWKCQARELPISDILNQLISELNNSIISATKGP